jgi:hypothetical protein
MRRFLEVDSAHVKYPAVFQAFDRAGVRLIAPGSIAQIVWWDGNTKPHTFDQLGPLQRVNKIPGMDFICYKSTTIHALQQMRRLFPEVYVFFPLSFLLPHQFTDLQRAHNYLQGKTGRPVTWIMKPRNSCCGHGIRLIQQMSALTHKLDSVVVQRYVPPFLIGGYKFDFRFYLFISSLSPFTVYIYREGLARFCTEKYQTPTAENLGQKFGHLTNTSINKDNPNATQIECTRLASSVLHQLAGIDRERGPGLWDKICHVSLLSLLAIWPSIVSNINNLDSARKMRGRKPSVSAGRELESFSKYFHILGIDIMIGENLEPVVLELNDRPSMVVTYLCEAALKRDMVADALAHLSLDGTPLDPPAGGSNWMKILPVEEDFARATMVNEIINKSATATRTWAANKERPHYEGKKQRRTRSDETFMQGK